MDSEDSLELLLEEESLDDSRLDSLGAEIWSGRRPTQESRWVKRSKPLKLARTSTVIIIAILHKKATSTHQNRRRL